MAARVVQQGDAAVIFEANGQLSVCMRNEKRMGSRGMWHGDNPLDFVLPLTLFQIILAIVASRVLYFILRPLRTPRFVCSVLGGIALGPTILGHNKKFMALYPPRQSEVLGTISTFGASYLIFIVALKMDVATTLRAAKSTWRFGIVPFITSVAIVSSLIFLYDHSPNPNVKMSGFRSFFSAVMSFSNFIVISDSLMELNLAFSELGQIALSSAMINDVMQWFTLFFVTLEDLRHSFQFLICYWVLILVCVFIIRPIMLMIVRKTPVGKPVKEVYIVCILCGVLVMSAVADIIGLSFLQGPLLFGLIMPNGPPLGTTLVEKTDVVISEFLQPLFFVFVGINTNLNELQNWKEITRLQLILFAGYGMKVLASMLVALSYKMRIKQGVVLGLMLNLKGIIELMTFLRMKRIGALDEQAYCHMVICVLLTTAILSPMIKILYNPHARLDISTEHEGKMRTIQDTPKNSEFNVIFCVFNDGNVHSNVAFLEACNPTIRSPICAYVVHFIELLGKSTPFLLSVDGKRRRQSLCINYPNTNHVMRAFENYADNKDGRVMVEPYVNVAPYRQMHESICNLAQDKNIPFIVVPFYQNGQRPGSHVMISNLRDLNSSFQNYAPCTVGILVDRFSKMSMATSDFPLHVAIFFIGGPDDREALALGIRMTEESENKNTKVSLFWFVLNNDKSKVKVYDKEEDMESFMDESFIDEFKAKNIGNNDVDCWEIRVEDGIGVVEAIRGLEGNYDLVMVGRRHSLVNLDDEEMSNFMENVDILGVIGDMLASTEFCNGMVPVLVTQCGGKRYGRCLNRLGSTSQLKMTTDPSPSFGS